MQSVGTHRQEPVNNSTPFISMLSSFTAIAIAPLYTYATRDNERGHGQ
jgi:hypothetical protein